MITFRLNVEALGRTSFGYSPLAEVAAAFRLLREPAPRHLMRLWVRDVRPLLEPLDLSLLSAVLPPGKWAPDFFTSWSPNPQVTIEQQLDEVSRLPAWELRADITEHWPRDLQPSRAQALVLRSGPELPGLVSDAIWSFWDTAIGPYLARMRAVIADDVAYRASMALASGVLSLFEDLHPEVSVDGTNLQVAKPYHAAATYDGTRITLLPSVFVWPNLLIGHERENQFTLIYPARGVARVWEGLRIADDAANDLGALVGRTRAEVLHRLEVPMTTTHLSRVMGQSPGTVSQHLSILRRNGLVVSWRAGRGVLYRRTPLGESIVAASEASAAFADLADPGGSSPA